MSNVILEALAAVIDAMKTNDIKTVAMATYVVVIGTAPSISI
jgi:hypothetical protein